MFRFVGRIVGAGGVSLLGACSGVELSKHKINSMVDLPRSYINGKKFNPDVWDRIKEREKHGIDLLAKQKDKNQPLELEIEMEKEKTIYFLFIKMPYGPVKINVPNLNNYELIDSENINLIETLNTPEAKILVGLVVFSALFSGTPFLVLQALNYTGFCGLGGIGQITNYSIEYALENSGRGYSPPN